MAKERFLTVLVPIKDSDVTTMYPALSMLMIAHPPGVKEINKIYSVGVPIFGYVRAWLNPSTNQYEYRKVVDREFPYIGKPLEIYDFTYDATRMGQAPTITAQGVMWYAEKDANGYDITLDGLWSQECHVSFDGEDYYLKQIPTSCKTNEDARYKYDVDFVAERVVLERVYIYDVVTGYDTARPISESATFSFYGDVNELKKRINVSLIRSGLSQYVLRSGVTSYISLAEWNNIGRGLVQDTAGKYATYDGDYSAYLRTEVYSLDENMEPQINGYHVVIDAGVTSEEKAIEFDKNTIHEALQKIKDDFELQYYFVASSKEIHIGDCEYDFGSENAFAYGVDKALLSIEKTNTTDKIVTRITGVGGEHNIPWHYPNPTPDGWLEPRYMRNGEEYQSYTVEHQTEKLQSGEWNPLYEKYLKNRLGVDIVYGRLRESMYNTMATGTLTGTGKSWQLTANYDMDVIDNGNVEEVVAISIRCSFSGISSITYTLSNGTDTISTITYTGGNVNNTFTYSGDLPEGTYRLAVVAQLTSNPGVPSLAFYFHPEQQIKTDYDSPFAQWADPYLYIPAFYTLVPNVKVVGNTRGRVRIQRQDGTDVPASDIFFITAPTTLYVVGDDSGRVDAVSCKKSYKYTKSYPTVDKTVPDRIDAFFRAKFPGYKGGDKVELYNGTVSRQNVAMGFSAFVENYIDAAVNIYHRGWYVSNKEIELEDYGITNGSDFVSPNINDTIVFHRVKYLTPQPNLVPEVYYLTDGERRFYEAVQYPRTGTPDTAIGETTSGSGSVINEMYIVDGDLMSFENTYIPQQPNEHIEDFDDVSPTIKEATNSLGQRIDVVEEFAYDLTDDDSIWESNEGNNVSGEYKHPHFFAKLRPLGFNIFDLALQEDMVISMTSGNCGACNFKIKVDDNTKKNPVQTWPYPTGTYKNGVFTLLYEQYSLRRYMDTSELYYKIEVDGSITYKKVSLDRRVALGAKYGTKRLFSRNVLNADEVLNQLAGSLNMENVSHIEGDVITSGSFQEWQQDTSTNEVWVALEKDTDTYGVLMPTAKPNYNEQALSVYIRPVAVTDANNTGTTDSEREEKADKFVFLNIKMPQKYLRDAEHKLSEELVRYMYDNNYQKYNFSIGFSRIYLAQNAIVLDNLNENSVLYVKYGGDRAYKQYVSHYTYKMTHDAVLPEISVDMNEELSVMRTNKETDRYREQSTLKSVRQQIKDGISASNNSNAKRFVGKSSDVLLSGNVVSLAGQTSLGEMQTNNMAIKQTIADKTIDIQLNTSDVATNRTKFVDFVNHVNTFNTGARQRINQIRNTVEARLPIAAGGVARQGCDYGYAFDVDISTNTKKQLWYNEDGTVTKVGLDMCPSNEGMATLEWSNYDVSF